MCISCFFYASSTQFSSFFLAICWPELHSLASSSCFSASSFISSCVFLLTFREFFSFKEGKWEQSRLTDAAVLPLHTPELFFALLPPPFYTPKQCPLVSQLSPWTFNPFLPLIYLLFFLMPILEILIPSKLTFSVSFLLCFFHHPCLIIVLIVREGEKKRNAHVKWPTPKSAALISLKTDCFP